VVALDQVDAERAQQVECGLILHPFGNRLHIEVPCDRDDRLHEPLVGRILGQPAYEVDVDLQLGDRKVL
jgi:hypothetical protein